MENRQSPKHPDNRKGLLALFQRLTVTYSSDPDEARQEYLTKVILVLIEGVLLFTTLPMIFYPVIGENVFFELSIFLALDILVLFFWWLAESGRWKIARYLPVVMCFLLGINGTVNQGLVTFLMGYVLAVVLAAFLLGIRAQWIVVALSLAVHFSLGSWLNPNHQYDLFSLIISSSSMLAGIALLQTMATTLLQRALREARIIARDLQEEVAERKRVEEALSQSEQNYRMLVENQGEGVVFVDPEENFTFANPAAGSIFGMPHPELVRRNLRDFTSPKQFQLIREQTAIRRKGEKSSLEIEITRPDGQKRTLLVTTTPLFEANGTFSGSFGVLRDITARIEAEAAMKRYALGMEALYDTAMEINAQTELPTLLQAIVQRAAGLIGAPKAALFLMSPGGNDLELVICRPPEELQAMLRLGEGLAGQVALSGEALILNDYSQWEGEERSPVVAGEPRPGRAMGVPLTVAGKVIGVLTVQDDRPGVFNAEEVRLANLFADQAALAIEKARLYAEVQRLATVDDLTGLLNRRGLWEFGRREFERARRFNRALAVIFLDIDHFKQINDTHGHAIGDQVLRNLSDRLRANTREVDVVARYGGEEFVILLPEVEMPVAAQIAERLRSTMSEIPADTGQGPVKISISLGVVQLTSEVQDLASLLDKADQAMFAAKQHGRNRVEVQGGMAVIQPEPDRSARPHTGPTV